MGNTTYEELQDLCEELTDRYGPLPEEAQNLIKIIELKQRLRPLYISKLEQSPTTLVFHFVENSPIDPQRLIVLIQNHKGKSKKGAPRLTPDHRLLVPFAADKSLHQQINTVLNTLEDN